MTGFSKQKDLLPDTEYLRNYYILRVCTLSQYWMVTETETEEQ